MKPWLNIIGIGEDGLLGLSEDAQNVLNTCDVIIGGDRHHNLSEEITAVRLTWPSPFDALIEKLISLKEKKVVILATGDPLWFSIGARLNRIFSADEVIFYPQLSAFQLAAVRMKWSMADTEMLTAHGRPVEQILPFFQPNQKMIILTSGSETPNFIAKLLNDRGFGKSEMTVLSDMGSIEEKRFYALASGWSHTVPKFNTLAINCIGNPGAQITARAAGLDDSLYQHDGNITKKEVRAVTISKLMPMRGALLWDVGLGCGSVAIEWMRAGHDCRAIGIEPKKKRRELAMKNALTLGTPKLSIIKGSAPDALDNLERPDAIFIGGGFNQSTFDICWRELKPFGRIVVNAVTLETEAELLKLKETQGGELCRISIQRSEAIGNRTGWRPLMQVTQWSKIKDAW